MAKSVETREEEAERVWRCPDCGGEHAVTATAEESRTLGELLAYMESSEGVGADGEDCLPF